jgi:hypothetical protein
VSIKTSEMSYVAQKAWRILRDLPDEDLLFRPAAALAAAMQIHPRNATKYLKMIREARLVTPFGPHGVVPIVIREGSVYEEVDNLDAIYAHVTRRPDRDRPPTEPPPEPRRRIGFIVTDEIATVDPCHAVGMTPTETPTHAVEIRPSFSPHPGGAPGSPVQCRGLIATSRSDTGIRPSSGPCMSSSSPETQAKKEEDPGRKPAASTKIIQARLRKVKIVARHVPGGGPLREETTEGRIFARLYEQRRRKVDPGYHLAGRDRERLQAVVNRLKEYKFGQQIWVRYIDHVFAAIARIREGKQLFVSPASLRADYWLDDFRATLGERPYSLDDAADVLDAGGFDVPGHRVISVLDWAVKMKYGRTVPPRLETENPEVWAQIKHLAAHLDEVGFDDDPEGGND